MFNVVLGWGDKGKGGKEEKRIFSHFVGEKIGREENNEVGFHLGPSFFFSPK